MSTAPPYATVPAIRYRPGVPRAQLLAGPATDRFVYAPGMRIAGGTSERQRDIIGERVLRLPREPR